MIKKIGIFICCYFCITFVYAKDVRYPVDTIALEESLKKIIDTRKSYNQNLGIGEEEKFVAEAQSDLLLWFMSNKKNTISARDIITKCNEIVGHAKSCIDFLNTYNMYLDHANFCVQANNFKLQNFAHVSKYENTEFTFHDCVSKTVYSGNHSSNSIVGECNRWTSYAQKCSVYLKGYYTQKLSNSKTSESDRIYYECLLEKIQAGDVDFPMSKMEEACK